MVQSDSSLKLVADYYNCYLTNCRHGCLDFFWDVDNIFDQKLGKTGDFHIFFAGNQCSVRVCESGFLFSLLDNVYDLTEIFN